MKMKRINIATMIATVLMNLLIHFIMSHKFLRKLYCNTSIKITSNQDYNSSQIMSRPIYKIK